MPKRGLLPKADQQRYQPLFRIMETQFTGVHHQQRESVSKFCYLGNTEAWQIKKSPATIGQVNTSFVRRETERNTNMALIRRQRCQIHNASRWRRLTITRVLNTGPKNHWVVLLLRRVTEPKSRARACDSAQGGATGHDGHCTEHVGFGTRETLSYTDSSAH